MFLSVLKFSRLIFLSTTFLASIGINPNQSYATTFSEVANSGTSILETLEPMARMKYVSWAADFAKFHSGKDPNFLRTCSQETEPNPLCYLAQKGLIKSRPTSLFSKKSQEDASSRKKFFSAVSALDQKDTRPEKCRTSTPILESVLRSNDSSRLAPRALFWLWTCANLDLSERERVANEAMEHQGSAEKQVLAAQDEAYSVALKKQSEEVAKIRNELAQAQAEVTVSPAVDGKSTKSAPLRRIAKLKDRLEQTERPIQRNKVKIPSNISSLMTAAKKRASQAATSVEKSQIRIKQLRDQLTNRHFFSLHHLLVLTAEDVEPLDKIVRRQTDPNVIGVSKVGSSTNESLRTLEAMMMTGNEASERLSGERRRAVEAVAQALTAEVAILEPEFRLYFSALLAHFATNNPSILLVTKNLLPLLRDHQEYIGRVTLQALYPLNYGVFDARKGTSRSIRDLIQELPQRTNDTPIDPSLMAGLIHQESGFNPLAKSTAGAIGLVQILIPTAQEEWQKGAKAFATDEMSVEQLKSLPITESRLKYDLARATFLGSEYLSSLLRSFGGSVPLALASYNSGPSTIQQWADKNKFSSPRIVADLILMDSDMELHASDYALSVMAKAIWYDAIYFSE